MSKCKEKCSREDCERDECQAGELPFVSCICPTFNRAPDYLWLLGEAVESFVRQDYPEDRRELLILNDAAGQTLACGVPGVRVINLPARCKSLGGKYNDAIGLARGSLILSWEDDDISLPNRISKSVEKIADAPYWNPKGYYFLTYRDGQPQAVSVDHPIGVSHNTSAFTRSAWWHSGRYPLISGAQDAQMDRQLSQLDGAICKPTPVEDWTYIYRWGVQPLHLSGRAPHDAFYAEVGTMEVAKGTFEIIPEWRHDYSELARAAPRK